MKLYFAILLIALTACNSNMGMKNTSQNLHDIWALKAIGGEVIDFKEFTGRRKQPVLEIFVAEKRIGGNDGCNSIFGSISELKGSSIRFGKLGGTKMACPDMEFSTRFTKALMETESFKVENLHLYLYNSEGEEILTFIKVD